VGRRWVFVGELLRTRGAAAALVCLGSSLSLSASASAIDRVGYTQLSNETTSSYWAYERNASPVYSGPSAATQAIARLHPYTQEGFREVYLLLRRYTDHRGGVWIKLRLPQRPNGLVGWVLRGALSQFHLTHWQLVVNEEMQRVFAYWRGHLSFQAPIAIGKPSTPTPKGHFWVREVIKVRRRSSGYWPYALGTSDYSTLSKWPDQGVVGIHGPYHQPQLIPGAVSHGCIRLEDDADAWIGRHIGVGTPVLIR
jgi:hypothetical protein